MFHGASKLPAYCFRNPSPISLSRYGIAELSAPIRFSPEEIAPNERYTEGARRSVVLNAYERNPQARAACIAHFGHRCAICDLLMEERYGSIVAEFIHVHHTVPLAEVGTDYRVNPKKDLRPVCPNCHAVIHRRKPPLTIAEARRLVRKV